MIFNDSVELCRRLNYILLPVGCFFYPHRRVNDRLVGAVRQSGNECRDDGSTFQPGEGCRSLGDGGWSVEKFEHDSIRSSVFFWLSRRYRSLSASGAHRLHVLRSRIGFSARASWERFSASSYARLWFDGWSCRSFVLRVTRFPDLASRNDIQK